jgi:beta-lactamase regulating signal transducer with metallopeptidase domain/beta-lactamase class D
MNAVLGEQSYQLLYGLGQGLIHSLWQCAALAVVLAVALALLRGRSPNVRYAAACSTLALMLIIPSATVWKFVSDAPGALMEEASEPLGTAGELNVEPYVRRRPGVNSKAEHGGRPVSMSPQPTGEGTEYLLPWVTLLWLIGVTVLSARTVGGLMFARGMRRRGARPVERRWREKAAEIAQRLSVVGPVKVLESSLVVVPSAVGWLRPAILLPASAFTGLTPQQLEAILAHELAHVRRHDYLVNILQTAVETLLFYHPAVWWVSRQIRSEREQACDDMAVSVTGDALTYARALTKVERLRDAGPSLALAADGGSLRARVLRLVEGAPRARRPTSFAAGLFFFAAILTTFACTRAVVLSQKQQAKTTPQQTQVANSVTQAKKEAPGEGTQAGAGAGAAASLIAADVTEGEDAEVRRVATAALGNRAGAVVVMNPRTGRVYAVVNQEWALRRGWAPASTMKLVTSLAGVGEKLFDPAEKVRVQGRAERLELTGALALSDNDYFKSLGARVGAGPIIDYARRLGLGERTGINYEGEIAGRLPAAPSTGSGARVGFGEGVEVTPVQLAVLVSAVANGGTLVVPRVPRTAQDAAGFSAAAGRAAGIPSATLEQVVPGMVAAVERGTASGIGDASLKIAGKTGTLANKENSLGLFASYAPVDDPRLTVVVLTSGDDTNGRTSAKIAGAIYRGLRGRLSE